MAPAMQTVAMTGVRAAPDDRESDQPPHCDAKRLPPRREEALHPNSAADTRRGAPYVRYFSISAIFSSHAVSLRLTRYSAGFILRSTCGQKSFSCSR